MNNRIAGYERNTSPPDDAPDARELVPEMIKQLLAGDKIPLLLSDNPPRSYGLADYVETIATRPAVVEMLTRMLKNGMPLLKDELEKECERDADFYADALHHYSEGEKERD